jgi:hypothetical protein
MVLNYQKSQTSVSKFLNVSLKDTPLGFIVKSCQKYFSFFYEIFFLSDLDVGKNLTEFAKIPMLESLKFFIIFFKKKKNNGVFRSFVMI